MDPDILTDSENTPEVQKRQATLKEMARRSQDRILVHNPTDADYTVRFDSIGFVVPNRNKDNGHGLGNAVIFRYVAINYMTQMINLILGSKMDEAVRLENEDRKKRGEPEMTKFMGGQEVEFTQHLRTDNQEARRKLVPTIWLGLVERYGEDVKESTLGKPKDDRPLDERLLDEIEAKGATRPQKRPVEPSVTITPDGESFEGLEDVGGGDQSIDLQSKDVFTLRKIAKDKGIDMEKTAKKEDLIKAISQ